MDKPHLTVDETRAMFLYVAERMIASKDLLTQADKAIGDGDHGIGMARGFEAVGRELAARTFNDVGDLLETIGQALLSSVGGAAGAIFGTFFRGAAVPLGGQTCFDPASVGVMLQHGLDAVQKRGKAKPGDKTMVDALEPAAVSAREFRSAVMQELLARVSEAARQGMERTKQMQANIGKSKTLRERSLGHPDPGAISIYLILNFMNDYLKSIDQRD